MTKLLRWYGVMLPLAAAVAAAVAGAYLSMHGGNEWCGSNSFSCSLQTNLIGVIAIGGATTYWYFGFRRGVLLARYRRRLRRRLAEVGGPDVREASVRVLAMCRVWGESWTTKRVAEHLGVASSTVRGHLLVARRQLRAVVGHLVPFIDDEEEQEPAP